MSSPSPASSSPDASLAYLPISSAAIGACAAVMHSSFSRFGRSVSQPSDFPTPDAGCGFIGFYVSRPDCLHLMAVRRSADSSVENFVEGVGEVLGMAMMDCGDEAAGLGPVAVSPAAQGQGAGRELMLRCLAEAKRRRIASTRLIAVVANITSFSLYHSLGFRVHEYMVEVHSHVSAVHYKQLSDEMRAASISVRPMQRDDIAACSQLHVASTSYSRLPGLSISFESQASQRKQAEGSGPDDSSTDAPIVTCHVAVSSGGAILGYCAGVQAAVTH